MTDNDNTPDDSTETEPPDEQGIDASETDVDVEELYEDETDVEQATSSNDDEGVLGDVAEKVQNARGDPEDGYSDEFLETRDDAAGDETQGEEVRPPETDDEEFAAKTTSLLQRLVIALKLLIVVPLVAILKFVPRSDNLADILIQTGFRYKRKLARADGVTMMLYGDGAAIPQANTINSQEKKYITENGDEYSYDAEGHQTWQIGGVPITFAIKGIPEVLEPAQTYLARQMRQNMKVDVPAFDDQGNQIGYERWVPVTTGDGTDGILVNFRSAVETFGQKITQDDLDDQYEKGFLKAVDGRTGKDKVMWGIMGLALGVGGTFVVQWLTAKISGGGGGGSIVPLVLDLGVLL